MLSSLCFLFIFKKKKIDSQYCQKKKKKIGQKNTVCQFSFCVLSMNYPVFIPFDMCMCLGLGGGWRMTYQKLWLLEKGNKFEIIILLFILGICRCFQVGFPKVDSTCQYLDSWDCPKYQKQCFRKSTTYHVYVTLVFLSVLQSCAASWRNKCQIKKYSCTLFEKLRV